MNSTEDIRLLSVIKQVRVWNNAWPVLRKYIQELEIINDERCKSFIKPVALTGFSVDQLESNVFMTDEWFEGFKEYLNDVPVRTTYRKKFDHLMLLIDDTRRALDEVRHHFTREVEKLGDQT